MSELPTWLHDAYDWTDGGGELATLRSLSGDDLIGYCRESAANAAEMGERNVTEDSLTELAAWLRDNKVECPGCGRLAAVSPGPSRIALHMRPGRAAIECEASGTRIRTEELSP